MKIPIQKEMMMAIGNVNVDKNICCDKIMHMIIEIIGFI